MTVNRENTEDNITFVSIPITRRAIRMADVRDFVEATEDVGESELAFILPGELRCELPS